MTELAKTHIICFVLEKTVFCFVFFFQQQVSVANNFLARGRKTLCPLSLFSSLIFVFYEHMKVLGMLSQSL